MSRKNYTSIKKIINDITIKSGKKLSFEPDDILYLANGITDLILPGDTFVEKITTEINSRSV